MFLTACEKIELFMRLVREDLSHERFLAKSYEPRVPERFHQQRLAFQAMLELARKMPSVSLLVMKLRENKQSNSREVFQWIASHQNKIFDLHGQTDIEKVKQSLRQELGWIGAKTIGPFTTEPAVISSHASFSKFIDEGLVGIVARVFQAAELDEATPKVANFHESARRL